MTLSHSCSGWLKASLAAWVLLGIAAGRDEALAQGITSRIQAQQRFRAIGQQMRSNQGALAKTLNFNRMTQRAQRYSAPFARPSFSRRPSSVAPMNRLSGPVPWTSPMLGGRQSSPTRPWTSRPHVRRKMSAADKALLGSSFVPGLSSTVGAASTGHTYYGKIRQAMRGMRRATGLFRRRVGRSTNSLQR